MCALRKDVHTSFGLEDSDGAKRASTREVAGMAASGVRPLVGGALPDETGACTSRLLSPRVVGFLCVVCPGGAQDTGAAFMPGWNDGEAAGGCACAAWGAVW